MSDETIRVPKMHPAEMRLARIHQVASSAQSTGKSVEDAFAQVDPTYNICFGFTEPITMSYKDIHMRSIAELEEIFEQLDLALGRNDRIEVHTYLQRLLNTGGFKEPE